MSERDAIGKARLPVTRESIARDLHQLGLAPGATVIVHSSLSAMGWVCGGPVTVIQALLDVVTPAGTVMMPTHSGDYSDPAKWQNPPVPKDWWPVIRETMPAFDPVLTPSRSMGRIPEVFRTWPGAARSTHPALSFAAWGQHTGAVIANHSLNYALGEGSPLARIYDLDGWVLLLGVGYDRNTSFHLAEYRVPGPVEVAEGAPVSEGGRRVWKRYRDIRLNDDVFAELGQAFEQIAPVRVAPVGCAPARLFRQRAAVDFAVQWLCTR